MSLKVKLVSCLSAFIIVASLMLISVFAATNVTLNIGGTVSFTANSVNALITGSIAGNASGGDTLTPIDIDASDSDGAVSMPTDWTNMDLTFTESASPITVTINIQNRSTDRAIAVSLTDSTNISNVTVKRQCDGSRITASDSRNILGGETITYTFELTVQSQNGSASGAFSLAVGLENTENVPSEDVIVSQVSNTSSIQSLIITTEAESVTVSRLDSDPSEVIGSIFTVATFSDPGVYNCELYVNDVLYGELYTSGDTFLTRKLQWRNLADGVTVDESDEAIIHFTITENSVIEFVDL